ncbi:hypothetical protein L210DRAFT_3561002 [Boletus edulis BED1]|uniref:Uncharacterized protein n=1 Tax=Boletus edulis BED1 TaxID=1328754 RepID=A0AAD4BIJ7_BOLED|nr:hypothetical protein L210DRAFT_3561002 [Boletus edulis BED1]
MAVRSPSRSRSRSRLVSGPWDLSWCERWHRRDHRDSTGSRWPMICATRSARHLCRTNARSLHPRTIDGHRDTPSTPILHAVYIHVPESASFQTDTR